MLDGPEPDRWDDGIAPDPGMIRVLAVFAAIALALALLGLWSLWVALSWVR